MKLGLTARLGAAYIVVGALLRARLIQSFGPAGFSPVKWLAVCATGAVLDGLAAGVVLMLVHGLARLVPGTWRAHFPVRYTYATVACAALFYEAAVEYFFFFDEFNTRFNHIAVDYDIGMMDDRRLAVLSLRRGSTTYDRLPGDGLRSGAPHGDLELDAVSVYQTAEELYDAGRLNVN